MADLLGSSVGLGIGLSGQPNQYANIYLANQQRKDAERARKQEALEKFRPDLDVKGVHRLLQREAEEDAASLLQELQDLKDNNPNNFVNQANRKVQEFKLRQASRLEQSGRYADIEKRLSAKRQANEFLTPQEDTLERELAQGSYDTLAKLPQDKYKIVNYDPNSRNIVYNPLPSIDTNKLEKEIVSDPNLKSVMSMVKGKTIPLPNGGSVYYSSESIPKTRKEAMAASQYLGLGNELPSIESLKDQLADNPAYMRRKIYELSTYNRIPKTFFELPEDAQKMLVAGEIAKDLYGKAGANVKQQIVAPPVPREGSGGSGVKEDEVEFVDPGQEVHKAYVQTTDANGNKVRDKPILEERGTTNYGGAAVPKLTVIATNFDVYDPVKQTFDRKKTSQTVDVQLVNVYPVFKKDFGSFKKGIILTDKTLAELKEQIASGKLNKSLNYFVETMAYAPTLTNPLSGTGGVEKSQYVPFNQVEAQVKTKLSDKAYKKLKDRLAERAAVAREELGLGDDSKPQVIKYKFGGRVYNIPSDQANEFLKDYPKAIKIG